MAKAIVPLDAFRARFGDVPDTQIGEKMAQLLIDFLHEATEDRKKKEPVHS
jgi:hypothetical protein